LKSPVLSVSEAKLDFAREAHVQSIRYHELPKVGKQPQQAKIGASVLE
jgi:hypothetical protein